MQYHDLLNIQQDVVLDPKEQLKILEHSGNQLSIGIPKERQNEEKRVALIPSAIQTLVQRGHKVFVEKGAGTESHYSDEEYIKNGAFIVYSPDELFNKSKMIVKVQPPSDEECNYIQEKQIIFSALNIGTIRKNYFKILQEKDATCIAYEYIENLHGELPIVKVLSEITGALCIQIAARYLESVNKGRGILLGGIAGIPASTVVILGAGTVGEFAARSALGNGAQVIILDRDVTKLREIESKLDRRVTTAISNQYYLNKVVKFADVLIGAISLRGEKNPYIITEEMVKTMKPGAVILDISIDQGGCIETSRPTSFSNPVFIKHNVTHYCVPNISSAVSRTASNALTNTLTSYILEIGDHANINSALWKNLTLRNGTYLYKGFSTKRNLTDLFGIPYRDIEILLTEGT